MNDGNVSRGMNTGVFSQGGLESNEADPIGGVDLSAEE
jgi:hypothetical protein